MPLAIHLWNIRQGKILKVGSIALITAASKKSSRSLRLTDILLFIIRCLLLALVALLLAWPVWRQYIAAAKTRGWILVPREILAETYHKYQSQIDSLRKAGYTLHEFNDGFNQLDTLQLGQALKNSPQPVQQETGSYWALLNRLNTRLSAKTPVYLYTNSYLKHFTGERPQTGLQLHWQTYTPADSVTRWIAQAWFTAGHTIRLVHGTSRPSGTAYQYYNINNDNRKSDFQISTRAGRAFAGLKGNDNPVAIDTAALRCSVYTDVNTTDAGYIKAALQTIARFTRRRVAVESYTNPKLIPAQQNWVFWLSEKPVPVQLQQKAQHVLNYVSGEPAVADSWLNTEAAMQPAVTDPKINLYKAIRHQYDEAAALWTDGFGNPVLCRYRQQQTWLYQFYSRFNPAWNDLVWDERFPQVLMKLISPVNKYDFSHDRRTLTHRQIMPLPGPATPLSNQNLIRQTDLRFSLWLIVTLLFLTERLLAHRHKNTLQHG